MKVIWPSSLCRERTTHSIFYLCSFVADAVVPGKKHYFNDDSNVCSQQPRLDKCFKYEDIVSLLTCLGFKEKVVLC